MWGNNDYGFADRLQAIKAASAKRYALILAACKAEPELMGTDSPEMPLKGLRYHESYEELCSRYRNMFDYYGWEALPE